MSQKNSPLEETSTEETGTAHAPLILDGPGSDALQLAAPAANDRVKGRRNTVAALELTAASDEGEAADAFVGASETTRKSRPQRTDHYEDWPCSENSVTMAEATTIRLTAKGPLDGSGIILLERSSFMSTGNDRLLTASIPQGSRVASDVFGFFGAGAIKAIRVSATTHNPDDKLRVYRGTFARTELPLGAGPKTVTLGPGEELAFVTEAATVLQLVVTYLTDGYDGSAFADITGDQR